MQVMDPETLPAYDDDHPTGALRQRYFFRGATGSPDNFELSLALTIARFQMIRHRHNFDQFRFPLDGDMDLGADRALRAGWLGYFPEGTAYGPQDDAAGRLGLVLQFGGASGYGYVTSEQYRAGRESLLKKGRFDGAVFVRDANQPGQRKQFSINAIWEETTGQRLLIPAPRYDKPIFVNPEACRWLPHTSAAGVLRKALGTFSEREAIAEMWQIEPDTRFDLKADNAIRLLFVLSGAGVADGQRYALHFAMRLDPGERGSLLARQETQILSFVLPLIGRSWSAPVLPGFEPVPGEAVPETH